MCPKEKIAVIGIGGTNGVDLKACDAFNHEETRKTIREQYKIPQDAFVYGYVGRLNKDKGINELVEAYEQIEKNNPNAYLMLVGEKDNANPISLENESKIAENDKIIATGGVPGAEVYPYMSAFDVLVHPTYREGYGKVLQEAMGMRIPIVTTNVIGPCEVVEGGKYGVLVEVKDSISLAQGMVEIAENEELRKTLIKKGRERAEQYYDRPIMVNNTLQEINKIMQVGNSK